MPPNVKVCINGFVLSTLLFDCTNNTCDQEGFLYGSITRNVRREISDHSMSNTQEDILISICSSVPSGSFLSFYNNVGEIKREELEYNLAERAEVQSIVGWYRFRRYSAMFPSIREQSVHKHLRDIFNSSSKLIDTSYFVFGVLSSSNLPNFATHSYDYGFFVQRRDGTFKDLPLTILNLGDTRNSYRAGSMALPFMNSSSFNSVLQSSWNFDTFFDTENQIHEFHQRLRAKLDSLQEELAASDAVNASLEDDIKRISNEMQTLLATQDFENEEHLNAKSARKSAEEAASLSELEDTTLNTCPDNMKGLDRDDLPSQQDDETSDNTLSHSGVMEELKVSSPSSNIEIEIPETDLQDFESGALVILSAFMINCIISILIYGLLSNQGFHGIPVDETVLPSVKVLGIKEHKELPSPISGNKLADISEASKSLSDSDICCKNDVSNSSRCGSAPAKFLSHATDSIEKKLIIHGSSSKTTRSKPSFSNIHPPFIVYASRKPDNESLPSPSGSLHISDSKPKEPIENKVVDENDKPSQEQKETQNNDVPEKSIRKME